MQKALKVGRQATGTLHALTAPRHTASRLLAHSIHRITWLMPGKDPDGWLATIALSIAGAFVGGFLEGFDSLQTHCMLEKTYA